MLKLIKKVSRETLSIEGRKKRPVIVSLCPGDEISFRVKGESKERTVYLGQCYVLAQILDMEREYQRRMKLYKERKEIGAKGMKRPHRLTLPFNKMYFEAIREGRAK